MRNILCLVLILGFSISTAYADPYDILVKCGCNIDKSQDSFCRCKRDLTGDNELTGKPTFYLRAAQTKGIKAVCTGNSYKNTGELIGRLFFGGAGTNEGGGLACSGYSFMGGGDHAGYFSCTNYNLRKVKVKINAVKCDYY